MFISIPCAAPAFAMRGLHVFKRSTARYRETASSACGFKGFDGIPLFVGGQEKLTPKQLPSKTVAFQNNYLPKQLLSSPKPSHRNMLPAHECF